MVGQFAENEPKAAGVVDLGKVVVDFFFAENRLVVEDVEFESTGCGGGASGWRPGSGRDPLR